MPNVESLEQHNVNYVKDDAFEREKKVGLVNLSFDISSSANPLIYFTFLLSGFIFFAISIAS